MRIIHTADWHLGNSIHSVDRTKEEKAFLGWLTDIINEQEIDALIVSGDVFDTYTPSIAAQKMYYSFLASLVSTKCKNVIIVGGNHDSGKMLEAPGDILSALNVQVVGRIENKKTEDMIFTLKGSREDDEVICAAVPYINELELRKIMADVLKEEPSDGRFMDQAYTGIYNSFLEKAEEIKGGKDIPVIATGHLYAAGLEGRYEGMEKEEKTDDGVAVLDVVGNLGKVHIGCFSEGFDYVALGHIHYKTRVAKQDRVMYSGSPFVMGFDDANIDHYIVRVDLGEGDNIHEVKPEFIKVPEWIKFMRVTGTGKEIIDIVKDLTRSGRKSEDEKAVPLYLELYYEPEDAAYLQEEIDSVDFPEHIKVVSWKIKKKEKSYLPSFGDYDIHSIHSITPEDVVKQLVLSKYSLSGEQKENMSEDEIRKYEEDTVNTYLPYFMKAFDEVSKEEPNEDN